MENVHELHRLVSQLIEVWPEDHNHPTVEQARQYLETTDIQHSSSSLDERRDYLDSLWYSL